MKELHDFLCTLGTLKVECESESSYYKINNKKVRVSNHITEASRLDLNIILPIEGKSRFIVIFLQRTIVFNSFAKLKNFIKNWALIISIVENQDAFLRQKINKLQQLLNKTNRELQKLQTNGNQSVSKIS